jgi:CRP-like cAMP-binding protein
MPTILEFLKSFPYFTALTSQEITRVEKDVTELSFDKGELAIIQGEACRGLYVVKSGQIRIFMSSAEGREQVLLIARSGDSFNDVPVFDGGPNPANAEALEPTTVYLVPKETIKSLVSGSPTAMAVIKIFGTRIRRLTAMVEDLSFRSVVSRLAKVLLELATPVSGGAPVPRLTQDEMAARIGSVRDVVGRALRTLEKEGAIKMDGQRIAVTNAAKLRDLI